jgi:phosphomannomutase
MYFAFDVDGTLTPSRQSISPDFGKWFREWISFVQGRGDFVLLVTGSDLPKTVEQLGSEIVDSVDYCCNCLGNTVYKKGLQVHHYEFNMPNQLKTFLDSELNNSVYTERYGNHLENRGAMYNFSVVGRNAVGDQRRRYYEWDKLSGERIAIANRINSKFSKVYAQVGGETGIDIIARGRDKRQVLRYMTGRCIHFYGDRMDEAGNDKPLADAVKSESDLNRCYDVTGWKETWELLMDFERNRVINSVY